MDNCRGSSAWLEQQFYDQFNANVSLSPDEISEFVKRLVSQVEIMVRQSGAIEGFIAESWVSEWLNQRMPALGGKSPAELIDTKEGQDIVLKALAQSQYGVFA